MKKQLPGFAAGILTAALVGALGFNALAATGQVTFNASALSLNGTQVSAKGENYTLANGQSVPASITYTDEKGGGTTYLPVRRISELLGVETGWDGAAGAVTVGSTPTPTTPPADPNRKPDITVDELKALFKYSRTYTTNRIDIFAFAYCGDVPIREFREQWKLLDQDDVKNAISIWAKEFYEQEYAGSNTIRLALDGNSDGTTIDFAGIRYNSNGASDFYFKWYA